MAISRAVLIWILSFVVVAPSWAAEPKPVKKPDQKGEQKTKAGKAKRDAKQADDALADGSTYKKVEGLVLRGLPRQMVEMREYRGLELKNKATDEVVKLLVPYIEDATTKRLSVDLEKLKQLSSLQPGWLVRVTYTSDKDWNWIQKMEVLDEGEDEEKDPEKVKKDDRSNNDRNRNRYNRNRRYNDRNRSRTVRPPQNNESKPSPQVPNPGNMKVPQKIAPMPMKVN